MAISRKTGKLYCTDEEWQKALENNNALEYAMSRGYSLVHIGNSYRLKEHDSMVFLPPGSNRKYSWYWNSQGLHGNAIDFMMHYEGMSKIEAVLTLANTIQISAPVRQEAQKTAQPKPFILPEKAENYRRMFAYLCKERGIDHGLVKQLETKGKIYQGVTYAHFDIAGYDASGKLYYKLKSRFEGKFPDLPWQNRVLYTQSKNAYEAVSVSAQCVHTLAQNGETRAYQNVVMVGLTPNHVPSYASMRSIGGSYKIDVTGSRKDYGFCINGNSTSDTVCVFESPIEAMSYWTLCKELNSPRISDPMLSLGGAGVPLALQQYLQDHQNIQKIVTGLNVDTQENGHVMQAGQMGTQRIQKEFGDRYEITVHRPNLNDWNDVLKNYRKNLEPTAQRFRPVQRQPKIQNRNQPSL